MHKVGSRQGGQRARVEQRVRALLGRPDVQVAPSGAAPDEVPSEPPGAATRLAVRFGGATEANRVGALAMAGVVAVVAAAAAVWVFSARPHSVSLQDRPAAVSAAARVSSPTPTRAASAKPSGLPAVVVVDVAGKVHRPGMYRLPPGSRVDDAVRVAGGALPGVDLTSLNLAAVLVDGQQVAVGTAGAPAALGPSARPSQATATSPVHLNAATIDQLETLPGVGPVLAQHILDWRSAHGDFSSIDQLTNVTGIGSAKFLSIRALVTL